MSRSKLSSLTNIGVDLGLFTGTLKGAFERYVPNQFRDNWHHTIDPDMMQVIIIDEPFNLSTKIDQDESPRRVWMRRIVAQLRNGDCIGKEFNLGETFYDYLKRLALNTGDLFAVVEFYYSVLDKGHGFTSDQKYFKVYLYKPDEFYKKLRRRMEDKLRKTPNHQLVQFANAMGVSGKVDSEK